MKGWIRSKIYQAVYSCFILFISSPLLTLAQVTDSTGIMSDSALITNNHPPKKFLRASAEFAAAQVLPWAWNRYYRKKDFTRVSFNSIGRNLNPENWRWDDNTFLMNQFVHPYHGSVYYNAFHCNGYGFWQSATAAIAGSFIWEIAGENHLPAHNDLINTSLGGISMGEMAFRLTPIIVNNSQAGVVRQLREVAGFLVNPVNGLNRILDKKWGRVYNDGKQLPSALSLELDAGSRRYNVKLENIHKGKTELFSRLEIDYGNPYLDLRTPFSNFSAAVEVGSSDSALFNMARIKASIYGWRIKESSAIHHSAVITMNYDYYRNTAFSYGAESFHMNLLSEIKIGRRTRLQTTIGGGLIALAAVPNQYLYYGEGRNYDYCSGVGLLTSGKLVLSDKISYRVNYRHNIFTTINGARSSHRLNTVNSEIKFTPGKKIFFSADWGKLVLNSHFDNYERTHRHYQYTRISAGYKLVSR